MLLKAEEKERTLYEVVTRYGKIEELRSHLKMLLRAGDVERTHCEVRTSERIWRKGEDTVQGKD